MRLVERKEILDPEAYDAQRKAVQARVFEVMRPRRIHVGEVLTFLFENTDTMRFQIQEMVRVERIRGESEIRHEIDTYNDVLGGDGELGATLLIEIDDPEARDRLLPAWIELPRHIYVEVEGGERVYCTYDAGQVGEERLSSVQYLKFRTGDRAPVAVGADLPALTVEARLTDVQRAALAADLGLR